jgi:hypothetical protein
MSPSNSGGSANGNGQVQEVKKENARGNGRHQQNSCNEGKKNPAVKQLKFVGGCKDLNGHIFDHSNAQGANGYKA